MSAEWRGFRSFRRMEEFKEQLVGEHSVFFEIYENIVLNFCLEVLNKLDNQELRLLWLRSEGYYDWDEEEEGEAPIETIIEDLEKELYRRVCSEAYDEAERDEYYEYFEQEDDLKD
ncbi:hypothetical protein F9B85_13825 [Heliorestis acidaminivorans]|uniref:Uncharacterized protein n=1 Tax=Heliorestis acidaminivorans TaxID=553427 RepID=A0A6I0EN19_9FIRM|nr:hypothetical protein [Heliorestis acidaminivorans]KAB2950839.1 hypothetical protein F9B85_13825 [Heliorestis acidaminivorans]